MSERAISVRLDDEAQRALELLMRTGRTQSEAVRGALLECARRRVHEIAAEDAERIAADPNDRREMIETLAFFDALDDEG